MADILHKTFSNSFLVWKLFHLGLYVTYLPDDTIISNPALVQVIIWHRTGRCQAIILTEEGLVYWRIHATIGLDEFMTGINEQNCGGNIFIDHIVKNLTHTEW